MKTTIYYFTGTGNTLSIAKDLARELSRELGDTELVPIASLIHQETIVADADAVGIAFPVYFLDMPGLVREFVKKLRFIGKPYIFGLAACGERPGGALFSLTALLQKRGATLAAGYVFVMPENYIGPIDLMHDVDRVTEKYSRAKSRIPSVAEEILKQKISIPEGIDSTLLRIGGGIARMLATSVYNTPRRLHATDKCNRCRTCERICPTKNITVRADGVIWERSCIQCYACIHWCPEGAIEIGCRTTGKSRYHHPDVTLADMLYQQGDA